MSDKRNANGKVANEMRQLFAKYPNKNNFQLADLLGCSVKKIVTWRRVLNLQQRSNCNDKPADEGPYGEPKNAKEEAYWDARIAAHKASHPKPDPPSMSVELTIISTEQINGSIRMIP